MTIIITAFERSPDGGKGLARDTRVRWALEEVGQPYEVRLVSFRAMKEPAHRALHPFGQIPTYEEGDLALFETGAIVFHIAERHAGLLPDDANGWARAITWMFALSVLLRLKSSGILDEYPNLAAYVARGEARPAYKRAFDAQLAVYTGKPPSG
jgi:glutathione S-transferase